MSKAQRLCRQAPQTDSATPFPECADQACLSRIFALLLQTRTAEKEFSARRQSNERYEQTSLRPTDRSDQASRSSFRHPVAKTLAVDQRGGLHRGSNAQFGNTCPNRQSYRSV